MTIFRNFLIALSLAIGVSSFRSTLRQNVSTSSAATSSSLFANYKKQFGRSYPDDSEEHRMREDIFHTRLAEIETHNARNLSWKMEVNHLTDWTHEELNTLNGHRPGVRSIVADSDSLLELGREEKACSSSNQSCADASCCSGFTCGVQGLCTSTETASAFDWSSELSTAHQIVEQGSCGSCWAVAATAALNLHAEIVSGKMFKKVLSPQSMLACPPNKLECGGQGGCKGATAEVAYAWLKSMGAGGGIQTIEQQPYTAKDGMCSAAKPSFLQTTPVPAVSIKGWKKLKENDAAEMMKAVVTVGPLVASIAANGLFGYSSGVIDSCKDNIVNHAVVLMGFGEDKGNSMNYWNVRNSWGQAWGEDGFFRLQRAAAGTAEPCGWDNKPEEGVACKDKEHGKYPSKQWVCGQCGFLLDTAYPVGTQVPQALLDVTATEATQKNVAARIKSETAQDNTWCKTECQHFGMEQLSQRFGGVDFGSNPTACAAKCDEHLPMMPSKGPSSSINAVASPAV